MATLKYAMPTERQAERFRFGVFEADAATGELWRKGMRVRLAAQPLQVLFMLLEKPGALLTREEIAKRLWPDGTFVDFDHGVNSAVNRIREAIGDTAANPRFVETLARRGYRFVAPVEKLRGGEDAPLDPSATAIEEALVLAEQVLLRATAAQTSFLASPEELPAASHRLARTLFLLLQVMYFGFYVGLLFNLAEVNELLSALPKPEIWFGVAVVSAAVLIPLRAYLLSALFFRAPGMEAKYLRLWPFLLPFDALWALAPFLLLHHIAFGVALACTALLVYSPFAQRSLVLMGAARNESAQRF